MKTTFCILALIVTTLTGCSSNESASPTAGQARAQNLIIGLWQYPFEQDEDNSNVLNTDYLEFTEDSLTMYFPVGMSNCFDSFRMPMQHVSGDIYSLDGTSFSIGKRDVYIKANESILIMGGPDPVGDELTRVENITSQDFNICTS